MTKDYMIRAMFRDQTAWDNNNSIKHIILRRASFRRDLNKMFRRKARRNLKQTLDKHFLM